uniref:glutathione transferase n=1 Tax=Vombatus ursinus TaxID=29139 RepID=A0A4X2L2Z9_VOMUR
MWGLGEKGIGLWLGGGLGWGYCLFFPAAPDFDKSQWLDVKFSLGLDFPNEVLKIEYLEQLPGQLKLFSLFLGKWTWFAGDKITYVDFLVCDVLDQNRKFDPCCLDDFANLKAFLDQFEVVLGSLPGPQLLSKSTSGQVHSFPGSFPWLGFPSLVTDCLGPGRS